MKYELVVNEKNKNDKKLELSLEKEGDGSVMLCSRLYPHGKKIEFVIQPDGTWDKVDYGYLNDL